MYKVRQPSKTTLKGITSYEGETIEQKIRRITVNKEPIADGAPLIYTNRKDGVMAEYDIKTDRFEVAIDAMDKVSKTHLAKREERHKPKEEPKKDGGAEPTQATA